MQIRNSIITMLMALSLEGIFAQNLSEMSPYGYATGSGGVAVQSVMGSQYYDHTAIPNAGVALKNSDVVQTGPGNYVEIQLDPSGAVVKIVENTTVVFNDLGSTKRPAILTLVTGRMRVTNINPGAVVTLQAGNAAIDFTRGDIALDFITQAAPTLKQPQLQITMLAGTAYVVPNAASLNASKVQIHERETILIDVTAVQPYVNRQPLNQEVVSYWSLNGFRHTSAINGTSNYVAQASALSVSPMSPSMGLSSAGGFSSSGGYAQEVVLPGLGADYGGITGGETFGGFDGADITSYGVTSRYDATGGVAGVKGLSQPTNEKTTIKVKNTGIWISIAAFAVGVIVHTAAYNNWLAQPPEDQTKLFSTGYAFDAAGFFTLLGTAYYMYKFNSKSYNPDW